MVPRTVARMGCTVSARMDYTAVCMDDTGDTAGGIPADGIPADGMLADGTPVDDTADDMELP